MGWARLLASSFANPVSNASTSGGSAFSEEKGGTLVFRRLQLTVSRYLQPTRTPELVLTRSFSKGFQVDRQNGSGRDHVGGVPREWIGEANVVE
jgi:hypothetical protein